MAAPDDGWAKRDLRHAEAGDHRFARNGCYLAATVIVLVAVAVFYKPVYEGRVKAKPVAILVSLIASPFYALAVRSNYKLKQCLAADADEALDRDSRPPVLYLRSFQDDGSGLRMPEWVSTKLEGRSKTHEERLVRDLGSVGPVVAIGRPGEPLPELGAARRYVSHDLWQSEVTTLMEGAKLVVLRLGSSPGLRWEFETMATAVPPERILLWLEPPGRPPDDLWRLLPCGQTPPPRGRYLTFGTDWSPRAGRTIWPVLRRAGLVHITAAIVIKWSIAILFSVVAVAAICWYGFGGWRQLVP